MVGRVAVHLAGILKPWSQQILGPRVATEQPPTKLAIKKPPRTRQNKIPSEKPNAW